MKNLSKRLQKEADKIVKKMYGHTYEDAIDILSAAICDLLDTAFESPDSKHKFGILVAMDIAATMAIYADADEFNESYDQTLLRLKTAYGDIWGKRTLQPVS